MIRFCSRETCANEAKWAPKLCVPATGYPVSARDPLSCIIGLPCCTYHVAALRADELLDPATEFGRLTRQAFEVVAAGRIPPDFARAFVERVSLNSPEFRVFEQAGGAS